MAAGVCGAAESAPAGVAAEPDRESEALLRTTLEAIDQGIVMVDAGQRVRVANQRARDLLGLPGHLLREGAPFSDVLDHQEAAGEFEGLSPAARNLLSPAAAKGGATVYERRLLSGRRIEFRTIPMQDGSFVRVYTDVSARRADEIALGESERRFRLLAENTTDVILLSDAEATPLYVSPSVTNLLGFEADELIGARPLDFIHPKDLDECAGSLAALTGGHIDRMMTTCRHRRKAGGYVWVEISFSLIRGECPATPTGLVAVIRDISDRKAIEQALRLSERRLSLAIDSGGGAVWDYDLRAKRINVSRRWYEALGCDPLAAAQPLAFWGEHIHADDRLRVQQAFATYRTCDTQRLELEFRMLARDGAEIWTLLRGEAVEHDEAGAALRITGTLMDITSRKIAEARAAHLASHDALTGLPNRASFQAELARRLVAHERQGGTVALLGCDLDGFKAINDSLGHATGDRLLAEVAVRLRAALDGAHVVARLGGDEFAVLVHDPASSLDLGDLAAGLIAAASAPYLIDGQRIDVGISIGIATAARHGEDADRLARKADMAMYRAKHCGRNHLRLYDRDMDDQEIERRTLQADLGAALVGGDLHLCFQPIVDLADGTIRAFEALVSWTHPTRGAIEPAVFNRLAERSGLIVQIGAWALRRACETAAGWPDGRRVCIGVSSQQVQNGDLEHVVMMALAAARLEPGRLAIEVAESALVQEPEAVIACLLRLAEIGVRIGITAFGSGASNLNHLRRLPLAAVKVDRAFLGDPQAAGTMRMVRAVVELARHLDIAVVAGGIESRDEMQFLREAGCAGAQGPLFCPPLPPERVATLIAADARRAAA